MLEKHIKWLMIVIGLITCSLILTVISPATGLQNLFGATLEGPLAEIIVRSWALLITITGALLIYAAFNPQYRKLVICIACISKTWFIAANLIYGQEFLASSMSALVFDGVAVLILLTYLFSSQKMVE